METESLLELQNISKNYPGEQNVVAVDNISLRIPKGDFAALIGPSGSGKTSLLNLCSGLDRPTSGKVRIGQHWISEMSNTALSNFRSKNIGFVFQAYNLLPVLTAVENVEYTLLIRGEDRTQTREKALEALNSVGLADKAHRYANQLSGGQQQRVAVARALASSPQIIFADEPTANLDSQTALQLINLFQDLNAKKNVTFLFSTHDSKLYQNVKTRVEMQDGKILQIKK